MLLVEARAALFLVPASAAVGLVARVSFLVRSSPPPPPPPSSKVNQPSGPRVWGYVPSGPTGAISSANVRSRRFCRQSCPFSSGPRRRRRRRHPRKSVGSAGLANQGLSWSAMGHFETSLSCFGHVFEKLEHFLSRKNNGDKKTRVLTHNKSLGINA
jgi:hypothetical protein